MKLHYRKLGKGKPLFIVHGLFGSSDNWQTLAKKFAEDFEVYLVDQRNHGHSPWSNEFGYEEMAADLLELINDLGLEKVILLGHSMGGKTVMTLTQEHPELVEKLVVVDIGPKGYPMHHQVIIEALESIDLNVIKTRKEAYNQISKYIENEGIKQFLLKNLYWVEKGKLGWRINIPVIVANMEKIIGPIPPKRVYTPTFFIRGEKSNYILDEDYASISDQFPNSQFETIYDAGHWVHAENPYEFYNFVMDFIR